MSERMNSIDALRIISAFFIECIHVNYFGKEIMLPIARFAVPVFFMISGYFFIGNKKESQLRNIKRIFILVILSNLLFFFYRLSIAFVKHKVGEFFSESFSINAICNFFVFNESPFGGHLWFLSALLYCMIIGYFLSKIKKNKKIPIIICLLLLPNFIVGNYSLFLLGKSFPLVFSRNFLFFGLPFFYIGSFFKQINFEKIRIKNYNIVGFIILFSITSIAEQFMLEKFNVIGVSDNYISSTMLALSVFALAIKNPCYTNKGLTAFLANLGRRYSLFIYILHPIVISIIEKIGTLKTINKFTEPLIVFAVSLFAALIYYKIKELLISKYQNSYCKKHIS